MFSVNAVRFMHPGKICICTPERRNDGNRVVAWQILRVVDTIDEARTFIERFDQDGIRDTVAINPSGAVTDAALAARFFRVKW